MGNFLLKSILLLLKRERTLNAMSEIDVLDITICQTCTCRFNKYSKTFITASFWVLLVALYYESNFNTACTSYQMQEYI